MESIVAFTNKSQLLWKSGLNFMSTRACMRHPISPWQFFQLCKYRLAKNVDVSSKHLCLIKGIDMRHLLLAAAAMILAAPLAIAAPGGAPGAPTPPPTTTIPPATTPTPTPTTTFGVTGNQTITGYSGSTLNVSMAGGTVGAGSAYAQSNVTGGNTSTTTFGPSGAVTTVTTATGSATGFGISRGASSQTGTSFGGSYTGQADTGNTLAWNATVNGTTTSFVPSFGIN